ncbi:Gfo/Idh/MocA family oxidoreductase [Luteolibacter algae]|uniref:Gfo/Idh/MocA family oxidoreductase n=1 Tax=Luteolibacter algae TaxID=454151 RepID=A0ABW5DCT2_9BACT
MNHKIKHQSTRRNFIKSTGAIAAGFTILPSYLTAARKPGAPLPPSERINLACIGIGGRARGVIPSLCHGGRAQPIALCDVDFESAKGAQDTLKQYPDAARFHDFREMFDKLEKDIDAVSVVTPDHTHFCAAILAMSLGKHVYVEKPLTRTFHESELLMRAEKKYGVVTQMGNQGHTGSGIDLFSKMVEAGLCNEMTHLDAWKTPSLWFMDKKQRNILPLSKDPVPDSLKTWDLWCGPRQKLPFNKLYHPFDWRGFYEYGMGMLGDWGAHIIDFVHDKLDMGLPTTIKSIQMLDHNQIYYPLGSQLSMHFPARGENRPAIDMIWKDGPDCLPEIPERFLTKGENGKPDQSITRGAGTLLYGENTDLAISRGHHVDSPVILTQQDSKNKYDAFKPVEVDRNSADHFTSFINACKGDGTTNSPFSKGGLLTQVLALGTIAQYLNTDLEFDPKAKQFVDNDAANVLLNPPARKEWEQYYQLA